ncbi:LamG domain-containing protein [Actinocrispum wychmicini]|uniref:Concanavalin A-like lectin/glucanase superfamily protein n=1 Tax=Actinocrispum wychmicini TaxID=1213861 RepID=A0A4R2JG16_9PSEU|nr:LamG domain-containing protein [Actinocrispum wychmicini]TCO55808.1 concanavalin A-like lectin/glucanase superfamily protein [Actinocrispum wychmicini]
MRVRRVVLAGVVAALAGAVVTAVPSGTPPGQQVSISEAPDAATAAVAAWRQGTRVEVVDQRTSTAATFAEPGGKFVTELSPVPVRAKVAGSWARIDTGLVHRPDGSVGPVVAEGELSLSGGGSDHPLASLRLTNRTLAFQWPGPLPVPVLSGSSATYSEVLPGVDLVMHAERNGFRQDIVVKNAEAARNPQLATVKLGVRADGLRLTADARGAIQATDESGAVVFAAPPSRMWDATGRAAPVGVSVVDGSLVLTPDRAFLADPALTYPVTVDPTLTTFYKQSWATVLSGPGVANTSYWNTSGDGPTVAQVGQCWAQGGRCNGIGEAWAYFQFDTAFLAGRTISAASLDTTVVHSPAECGGASRHRLHRSNGDVYDGLTWNNRIGGSLLAVYDVPTTCGGGQPVTVPVPADQIASGGSSTYILTADDGADQWAWRKYDPGLTVLRVSWNRPPNVPYDLTTVPSLPGQPCKWCGDVSYVADDNIRLVARVSDPDGDMVLPQWRVRFRADGLDDLKAFNGVQQISGASHDTFVDLTGRDKQRVDWWVHASDGTVSSDLTGGRSFVVDRVAPDKQPTVTGVLYQEDGRWHGGVGVPGTFTFGANGVIDIDHYLYGWNDQPSTQVDAQSLGGQATVALAPDRDGPRDLFVQSVDRAGHRSATRVFHIYVRAGNGPLAQWSFEGNTTDTAFLGDRHGTLNGGASYTPQGALGSAIQLDGADDHVSAPNAIRNDAGFTVSTWVRLADKRGARAAVSQDGAMFPGFVLWHRGDVNGNDSRWVFGVPNSTATDSGVVMASSPVGMPGLNTWTHLAGVRDPGAREIRLYVNGVLAGKAPYTATPEFASGLVRIGRTMWGGSPANDHWSGGVDEVRLYDRVLQPTEIAAAVSSSGVQAAHWKFDEASGITARNAVDGGLDGVLENGAAFVPGGASGGAVHLDGDKGAVSAGGPVVRTDQSFSAAAWVRADRLTTGGASMTAISQDGNYHSGFYLQYNSAAGKWMFVRFTTDDDKQKWMGVSATQQPKAGEWVHLAATFDAANRQMRIYVNGELGGSGVLPVAPWRADGPLVVGRAKFAGQRADYWPGSIDEVRLFNRVISEEEVRGLVSRDDVVAGAWKLDGNANDVNGKLTGTLNGGAEWTAGQTGTVPDPNDLAVKLNGADAYVSAPKAVDTDRSFSVAAWVRLDSVGGQSAVVSQDGQQVSGFALRALADGRWDFVMPGSDEAKPGDQATGQAAQRGVWTHLVGVYRKDTQRIELYVNGVLAASAAHTGGFNAGGGLQIGRAKWNGDAKDFFPGAVDDVTVYSRPLFLGEIQRMADRDLSLGHQWPMDEGRGTTIADAVGSRGGTLENGATFTDGRVGNAVRFDGVDDGVSTTGVDVRTDTSFTVSSWVFLDGHDCDLTAASRCVASAVSLDGGRTPVTKFRLGHLIDDNEHSLGKWVFEMPELADGSITKAAVDTRPGQLNAWVHLVGVYDAPARTIWLHVDGTEKASGTLLAPWQATGPLRVGRDQAGGFWRGKVDDVRMYSGALTADRISALRKSYPAQDGPAKLPVADAGWWKMDEPTGTTAVDSSGRGLNATMSGGAGRLGGRAALAAWFDGSTGYAETAGPVVDTSGSFSVAAWAYLTDGTKNATVTGQDGNRVSAFSIQYDATAKRWAAVVPRDDKDSPDLSFVLSSETATPYAWTHVVLVYNAPLSQLRLYVNGGLSAVQVGVTVRPSNGPLSIGRCKSNGAKGCYFPRGIDDVRAYGRALTDGEVRRVHDDAPTLTHGYWRFDDGTGRDNSWRQNAVVLDGGRSFEPGPIGQALKLDGVSGTATAPEAGVPMWDSFTVAAWARLDRVDKPATVLSQDGSRRSGYQLQYRPELNRWVFGAASRDADDAPLVLANSLQPPVLGQWTHLTGVYDYPARQLRLYVNGELVGTRDSVLMWLGHGKFAIGRAKTNGAPAEYFPGAVDEVTTDLGVVPDPEIRARATRPAPSGGQVARFVNEAGDHYTTTTTAGMYDQFAPVPPGYRFDVPLGMMLSAQGPNSRRLYACVRDSTDEFTSIEPGCEGAAKVADLGWVFTTQPTDWPTVPLNRCRQANGELFDSSSPTCEGQTLDRLLGYMVGYAPLTRYVHPLGREHTVTTGAVPPGYRFEGTVGLLGMVAEPGTVPLMSCMDGVDQFVSTDPACGGKAVTGTVGQIWTSAPAGRASAVLYQCAVTSGPAAGQVFASRQADCEGQTVRGQLGYVLVAYPGPTAAA